MAKVSKRLEFLLKVTAANGAPPDPFALYGLAMEHRALERYDDALAAFEALRAHSPDYVPMYLMAGQMLEQMGRVDEARGWLTAGIAAANVKGDSHAASELEAALHALS